MVLLDHDVSQALGIMNSYPSSVERRQVFACEIISMAKSPKSIVGDTTCLFNSFFLFAEPPPCNLQAEPPHLSLVRSCMFFFAQIFCTDAAWVVKIVNLELSRKRNQSINTLGKSGLSGCPQDQGKNIQTTNRNFAFIYSMQNNALRLTQPKNCEGKKISEVVQCPLPLNPYDNGKVFIGNCNSSNVACLVPPRHRRATVLEHGQMLS